MWYFFTLQWDFKSQQSLFSIHITVLGFPLSTNVATESTLMLGESDNTSALSLCYRYRRFCSGVRLSRIRGLPWVLYCSEGSSKLNGGLNCSWMYSGSRWGILDGERERKRESSDLAFTVNALQGLRLVGLFLIIISSK